MPLRWTIEAFEKLDAYDDFMADSSPEKSFREIPNGAFFSISLFDGETLLLSSWVNLGPFLESLLLSLQEINNHGSLEFDLEDYELLVSRESDQVFLNIVDRGRQVRFPMSVADYNGAVIRLMNDIVKLAKDHEVDALGLIFSGSGLKIG
ncbi:hypothetical protein ACFSM5_11365 [Lacibacterium aquatile]|uniref:Uncharacterized protein n=1 Tax=Lacibacterium aquatile TaxID=1168082 RepID=A0ABW5DUK0_9PROT